MWEHFRRLRSEIYRDADEQEETCFVIDAGIAELLKWKKPQNDDETNGSLINVVDISSKDLVDNLLMINPGSVIVWVSFIEEATLFSLKEALKKANIFECVIVSHYNSASLKVALRCEDDGEEYLRTALQPIVPKLFFSPTYSFPIMHETTAFEFRIATCHRDRHVHSLTYSSLAKTSDNKCIHDISAADLPTDIKQSLKHLAHNVAGSVICELGLDVSDSMFAMGKTASLIGHSMLTMFDGYHDLRTATSTQPTTVAVDPAILANKKRSTTTTPVAPLQPASLILVDRIEDLFTPILMGGDQPVLHRVLNAIKTDAVQAHTLDDSSTRNDDDDAEVLVDIALKPDWLRALHTAKDVTSTNGGGPSRTDTAVSSPMNGVSTLAVHHVPSICHLTADGLLPALMTESEDVGRGRLVDALKQQIREERGTLPPAKKRGIGAEILALVQSLLKAPGKEQPVVGADGHPALAPTVRTQSLLAIAATVIETMQRSSTKQFSSVCAWKAALDTRISRESDWQKVLASVEFSLESTDAELIAAAMAVTQRPLHHRARPAGTTTSSSSSSSSSGDVDGPADVSQILLLTVGLMGFMRFRTTTLDFLQPLAEALAKHLLVHASDDELWYLRHLGLLTSAMDEIIAEARFEGLDAVTIATEGSYTLSTLTTLVGQRFAVLRELETMHRHVLHRVVAKKVAEAKNLPWDITAAASTGSGVTASGSSSSSGSAAQEIDRMAEQVLHGTPELQYLRQCFRAEAPGLLAKVIEDCLVYQRTRQASPLSLLLEHVQSPFQQMKNTGLELLSKGLGSWGFGLSRVVKAVTEAPHPGAHRTVVLFVLGGITYKEVAQIRSVLEQQLSLDNGGSGSGSGEAAVPWRVIVWTTRTISSEEVLATLFRPIAVGPSAVSSTGTR